MVPYTVHSVHGVPHGAIHDQQIAIASICRQTRHSNSAITCKKSLDIDALQRHFVHGFVHSSVRDSENSS